MNAAPRHDHDATFDGEHLSAFIDGELSAQDAAHASSLWRDRSELRATWHAYHLIGDVMRSDELSSSAVRDAAFLKALRERLLDEPVVLAPSMPPAAHRSGRYWLSAGAIAAGFAVVAVAVVVIKTGAPLPEGHDGLLAERTVQGQDVRRVGAAAAPTASQAIAVDGKLIRDARLDAYFDAHRGAVSGMPSAVPGGALRSVDTILPQR